MNVSSSICDYSLGEFCYHKCIFIHVPKTGGISVCQSLFNSIGGGHYTANDYINIFGRRRWDKYFKFSVVRHPRSRLISAYNFLINGGINDADYNFGKYILNKYKNLNNFVRNGLCNEIDGYIHFKPQWSFLYLPDNYFAPDFLARYETIEADYKKISSILKIEKPLIHSNKTFNKKDVFLDVHAEKLIFKLYKPDYQLFNYDSNINAE